jgi:hypothetical protein
MNDVKNRVGLLAAAGALALATAAGAQPPKAAAVVPAPRNLALQGLTQIGDRTQVLLVDLNTGKRATVALGESAFGYRVKGAQPEAVVLTRGGREFVVRLGDRTLPVTPVPPRAMPAGVAASGGALRAPAGDSGLLVPAAAGPLVPPDSAYYTGYPGDVIAPSEDGRVEAVVPERVAAPVDPYAVYPGGISPYAGAVLGYPYGMNPYAAGPYGAWPYPDAAYGAGMNPYGPGMRADFPSAAMGPVNRGNLPASLRLRANPQSLRRQGGNFLPGGAAVNPQTLRRRNSTGQ